MWHVTFCMSHDKLRMSHVIYKMLMVILGTCWTTFVLMSLLKSEYLKLCHMPHVACHMSHCACHLSYVKCLCWSLGHAEQILFSCLCSKVGIYRWKWQCVFLDSHRCDFWVHRAGSQLKKLIFRLVTIIFFVANHVVFVSILDPPKNARVKI